MFGVALAVYYAASNFLFDAFCPLVIVTGIPCPGCGMTRALLFLLTGQWERSFHMNPLAAGWVLLAVYICVMRYVFGRKAKGALPAAYVLIGLMAVLYIYRMVKFFPGTPPISYTGGNFFEKIMPWYRSFILKGEFRNLF